MHSLFVSIVLLATVVLEIIFVVYGIYSLRSGAPFIPSSNRAVKQMIRAAEITPGQTVIDLGSGDGRILLAIARAGGRAVGIEVHPLLVWWSRLMAFLYRLPVTVIRASFWTTDISSADCIILFGIKSKMPELQAKIAREVRPGTRIVSNIFSFPEWHIDEKNGTVYVYRVPESTV